MRSPSSGRAGPRQGDNSGKEPDETEKEAVRGDGWRGEEAAERREAATVEEENTLGELGMIAAALPYRECGGRAGAEACAAAGAGGVAG